MSSQMNAPAGGQGGNRNMIIAIVVAVVLLCCCCVAVIIILVATGTITSAKIEDITSQSPYLPAYLGLL